VQNVHKRLVAILEKNRAAGTRVAINDSEPPFSTSKIPSHPHFWF
jgi:hypothetical protein